MTGQLNVLVVESDRGAADVAESDLIGAGHSVVRCHEPGAAAFPCNALAAGRTCPLEGIPVDVVLDVRLHARTQPTPTEDGIACAIRHHVPLVVAGPDVLNPFEEFATATIGRDDDIVGSVEHAARAPLPKHTDAAARAIRAVLDSRGLRTTPIVSVRRAYGALVVDVSGASELDRETKDVAAVRIVAAIREIDRASRGIDVRFVV